MVYTPFCRDRESGLLCTSHRCRESPVDLGGMGTVFLYTHTPLSSPGRTLRLAAFQQGSFRERGKAAGGRPGPDGGRGGKVPRGVAPRHPPTRQPAGGCAPLRLRQRHTRRPAHYPARAMPPRGFQTGAGARVTPQRPGIRLTCWRPPCSGRNPSSRGDLMNPNT